ncbi:hypothetical protein BUALT_Bualt18G0007100 [Buddleja alternifolia]|uniref:Secreted protein n=1 Tax=Buddleja alternifolia TaxID=168488 RepID=A0AAV6WA29_9LAMI|nr:hypothetical protein BUALT_Bualt18G0007100 [Buddleja alternifolia]
MRCGALHLIFVGLPFSGACVPAFLCNKPLRPKTSGRWSCGAFGKRLRARPLVDSSSVFLFSTRGRGSGPLTTADRDGMDRCY